MNKVLEAGSPRAYLGLENQNWNGQWGSQEPAWFISQNNSKAQELATPSTSGNRGEECLLQNKENWLSFKEALRSPTFFYCLEDS